MNKTDSPAQAAWRIKHRERLNALAKELRHKNKAHYDEYRRQWVDKNRDKINERNRARNLKKRLDNPVQLTEPMAGALEGAITHHSTRHGHTSANGGHSPTYRSWAAMKSRCLNPNFTKYASYGAVGITVCERWARFNNFLEDMGPRPPGTTIGRINNNGNYEPCNCRWETPKQQGRNKKNNVFVICNGARMLLQEAAPIIGMDPLRLYQFLRERPGFNGDVCSIKMMTHPSGRAFYSYNNCIRVR